MVEADVPPVQQQLHAPKCQAAFPQIPRGHIWHIKWLFPATLLSRDQMLLFLSVFLSLFLSLSHSHAHL